jgi:hypothetical protein
VKEVIVVRTLKITRSAGRIPKSITTSKLSPAAAKNIAIPKRKGISVKKRFSPLNHLAKRIAPIKLITRTLEISISGSSASDIEGHQGKMAYQ